MKENEIVVKYDVLKRSRCIVRGLLILSAGLFV